MSESKVTTSSSVIEPRLCFMTYNVDQAVREEQVEETKWANRAEYVRRLIQGSKADLIHLQEMRNLDGNPTPETWLSSLGEYYRFVNAYRNSSKYSFGQATVYDSRKLFPIKVVQRWLSDTPETPSDNWPASNGQTGFGSVVLFTQFAFVDDGKVVTNLPRFWSVNVHFLLDEDVKTKSCYKLLELIDQVCEGPVVMSGDFNFFPDRDGNKQSEVIRSKLNDLTVKMITSQERREIQGTFVGYPHDAFCAKDSRNPGSHLDYIFGRNMSTDGPTTVITSTYREIEPAELTEPYLLPSDHLPLMMTLKVDSS